MFPGFLFTSSLRTLRLAVTVPSFSVLFFFLVGLFIQKVPQSWHLSAALARRERRPHRARHCWSRSGTTRVGAEETQPTNTEAWWLTAASGQVPSGPPGKRPCVPDPSGVLPTKLPSPPGGSKPSPASSLQAHAKGGARIPPPRLGRTPVALASVEWQVYYRKRKAWALSSKDPDIFKNVRGKKKTTNPKLNIFT